MENQTLTRRCARALGDQGLLISLLLATLGVRLTVFRYAGSPLPFFDQWMAEFDNGLMSIVRGHNLWTTLSWAHNEHLLVTTKLLTLAGFSLNGYWDVPFLAVVSAAVRALGAGWAFTLLSRGESPGSRLTIWGACLVVFAAPSSGYNLLSGLQVSFFLADLALLGSLAAVIRWKDTWRDALMLILAQAFGLLSFGSALAIPVCTGLAAALLGRRSRRFWIAWTIAAALCAIYVLRSYHPTPETARAFPLEFFLQMLSWPGDSAVAGAGLLLLAGAGIAWIPLGHRPDPARVASAGLVCFAVLNTALIAWSRQPDEFHPRHWDTLAFFPLGLISLGITLGGDAGRLRLPLRAAVIGLALASLTALGWRIQTQTRPYLVAANVHRAENIRHYREHLLTGRIREESALINRALESRDYAFFDHPRYRHTLPPIVAHNFLLRHLPALSLLAPEIIPARTPSLLGRATQRLVEHGHLLLWPALAFVVVGSGVFRLPRDRGNSPPAPLPPSR